MSNFRTKYLKIACNLLWAVFLLIFVFAFLPKLLIYFMPFVVGMIFAMIANPMVKFLEKRIKINRKYGSVIMIVLVIGLVVLACYGAGAVLAKGIGAFMAYLPTMSANAGTEFSEAINQLQQLLEKQGLSLDQMDVFAATVGPGSFTGLRIGVAAAKGLAWPGSKPCAACSTLESMAWGVAHMGMDVCAVMDARRNQVYNARFLGTGDGLERLTPDRAIGLDVLAEELKNRGKPQILVGDGAVLCYTTCKELGLDVRLAPPHLRQQSAWGVARCALELARSGRLTDAASLVPEYHRLSQAERERLEKERNKGE